jgi:hypothetical protein
MRAIERGSYKVRAKNYNDRMQPGQIIAARFELERVASTGGMGVVYRAVDRLTGGLAAVKVVGGRAAGGDGRFVREAETLAALRHPGIVSYLAHGTSEDGELYLAMEWLDGEDLASRLVAAEIGVDEAIAIAAQVAAALAAAHAHGVIHRDVKPSNVFLVDWRTDRVKLLDFGVARRAGLEPMTATGAVVGTPFYMSPEQARGGRGIDARADVYALGALLFRCLTGQPPFPGATPDEVIARILSEPAPRLRDAVPGTPAILDDLVARMLAKDPDARPRTAAAVHATLGALDATWAAASAPAAAPPAPPPPPLFGRSAEREAIAAAVAAPPGRASLLLFTGESGLGKSRLLDEAAAVTAARAGVCLRGRAFEAEMVRPYGPWIDALRGAPADVAPLVPDLAGGEAPDRNRLFDSVVRCLARIADGRPLALVLDDLHWFDEASAALLHFVVRGLDGRGVVIAAAARPIELGDNPAAAGVVRSLARDGRVVDMALAPLGPADAAALVRAFDPNADGEAIGAASEGNPLYALEIARARRAGQGGVSASLEDLLDDRLARLDGDARALLPFAAALGRSFDLELLARVTGQPLVGLVDVADRLERRGVVRIAGDGYDFAHDLLRQAAYRQLSEPRRRVVHLAIARALADADAGDAVAGDVAHHAALGGDAELSARSAVRAGARCLRVFANAEATEVAERGLAVVARVPRAVAVPIEIELYDVLSWAGRWSTRMAELAAGLERAIADADRVGLAAAARRGREVLGFARYKTRDFDGAYDSMMYVLDAPSEDPAQRAEILAAGARCLVHLEREIPRAETMLRDAQALAERAGVTPLDLPLGKGMLAYFRGELDAAQALLEDARRRSVQRDDHWRACEALAHLARIALERRRPAEALARCAELGPMAARLSEGSEAPFAAALDALARLADGRPGADAAVDRAIADLIDADCKHQLAYVLNTAAALDLDRGRLDTTRARAEKARATARTAARPAEVVVAGALLARAALAQGERDTAERYVREIAGELTGGSLSARSVDAARSVAADLGVPVPEPKE